MRAPWWMIGVALAAALPLLHADGNDNEKDKERGLSAGQGGRQAQAAGPGPAQGQPQGPSQERFPTASAVGKGDGPGPRKAAPRARAPRAKAAPRAASPRAAGTAPAPGIAQRAPSASMSNGAARHQRRPRPGTAATVKASAGPTSNLPGVGVKTGRHEDRGVERAAGRQKLASLGVAHAPRPIADRRQVLRSSAGHSGVAPPTRGPDNRGLTQSRVDLRHFRGSGLGARMQGLSSRPRMEVFARMNAQERQPGRYYWHDDGGQRYCHYLDPWGYQWYGWYGQDDVLWVRYYGARWWNYDADMGRWVFWDDGQWWWQDDAGGNVYVYVDGAYYLN